jgi:hypothetical protein
MRAAGATAGMLSAAMLLAPGCDPGLPPHSPTADEPVRRANFRSLAARDFLFTCSGGASRTETVRQLERFAELTRFGRQRGADHAIWLGENDWNGLSRHDRREPCEPGEEPYREALAAFEGTLDELAGRIGAYPQ